ncbi:MULTISPECIES: hypothetical protein [unclassified Luteimonas]|uniref:hypothetical protein n=1 Tax=unclassified Luteimonas TaxID=2629088 RepID=UPI0011AB00EF|nr:MULTISPECIES: hypothetical protein [unclassified Luteimonas]
MPEPLELLAIRASILARQVANRSAINVYADRQIVVRIRILKVQNGLSHVLSTVLGAATTDRLKCILVLGLTNNVELVCAGTWQVALHGWSATLNRSLAPEEVGERCYSQEYENAGHSP